MVCDRKACAAGDAEVASAAAPDAGGIVPVEARAVAEYGYAGCCRIAPWDAAGSDDDCKRDCRTPSTERARSDASLPPVVPDSTSEESDRGSSRDPAPSRSREWKEVPPQAARRGAFSPPRGVKAKAEPAERAAEVPRPGRESPRRTPAPSESGAPAKIRLTDLPYTLIEGVKYPGFIKESAVLEMRQQFSARAGDVFLASNFPILGLQRVLTALVEGRDDPWAPGLTDRPYFLEPGASRVGAQQWIQEANSWKGRRCLKTVGFPQLFPCRYPFDAEPEEGMPAPKIVVLVADPRNYLSIIHNMISGCMGVDMPYTELLEQFLDGGIENMILGNWIEYLAAWSAEAARDPETVRLVSMDRLGSLDPKEFARELMEVASFIGVAEDAVQRLTQAVFRRPNLVMPAPAELGNMGCELRMLHRAVDSGHLVEQSAKNKYMFEDALSQLSAKSMERWVEMLASAYRHAGSPCVIQMAQMASRGVLSLPPVAMTEIRKGEAAHSAGLCKPCVFALRGICKDGEDLCRFCHDPSHPRTKRTCRSKRLAKKALGRIRTPSPGSPAHARWD
mmetsp:Transcript_12578/g.33196  ORF Transcript_12578/g.33196 Transcript_12578/m.33196 type:complete len:563 (+) Transcript_12578:115-1803(+)